MVVSFDKLEADRSQSGCRLALRVEWL